MSAQKHALLANRGFSQHFNDGGCAYGVLFGNRNRAYERNCRHNKNGKRHDKRPNDFCKRDFPGAVDAVVVARRNGGGFGIFAARCGAVLVCYEACWKRDFACVCCMHSFCVVGNVSKTVKLDKLSKLIKSASTWLVGIAFGLFATFLTVQGVTGGAVDKFGFNVAKFAVSSYVPVLGGYLSDGLDLLTASVVLVKNALGYVGAIVLCSIVLFPIVKVVVFSLTLKLTSAVCEPLGDTRTSNLLFAVSKTPTCS